MQLRVRVRVRVRVGDRVRVRFGIRGRVLLGLVLRSMLQRLRLGLCLGSWLLGGITSYSFTLHFL